MNRSRSKIEHYSRDVELISTIAHELRTPLTSIKGSIALVLGGAAGECGGEAAELLSIARNNCDRLIRLVDDLLDLARAEAGVLALRPEPIGVEDCLRRAMESLEPYAAERGVVLRAAFGDRFTAVFADPDRIDQVAVNLISNAVKFSPAGGTVTVDTELREECVSVSVADEGPGIPRRERRRVFERFFQGRTASSGEAGVGLGLAICKAIVEEHGGSISVRDNPEGGAMFVFTLPAAEESAYD